jgi:hypothetical protein
MISVYIVRTGLWLSDSGLKTGVWWVRFVKTQKKTFFSNKFFQVPRSWCISFFPNVHSCIYINDQRVEKRLLNRVWKWHIFLQLRIQIPFSSPNFHKSRFMNPVFFCSLSIKIHSVNWIAYSGFLNGDWSMSPFFKTQISPWRKRYFAMYPVMKVA